MALLAVTAISMLVSRRGGRFGTPTGGAGYVEGSMTITSAATGEMDRNGERRCTVTGTVVGPGASAVEVYGPILLPSGARVPFAGEERPVVYKPGKAESTWRFGTLPDSVG